MTHCHGAPPGRETRLSGQFRGSSGAELSAQPSLGRGDRAARYSAFCICQGSGSRSPFGRTGRTSPTIGIERFRMNHM